MSFTQYKSHLNILRVRRPHWSRWTTIEYVLRVPLRRRVSDVFGNNCIWLHKVHHVGRPFTMCSERVEKAKNAYFVKCESLFFLFFPLNVSSVHGCREIRRGKGPCTGSGTPFFSEPCIANNGRVGDNGGDTKPYGHAWERP